MGGGEARVSGRVCREGGREGGREGRGSMGPLVATGGGLNHSALRGGR